MEQNAVYHDYKLYIITWLTHKACKSLIINLNNNSVISSHTHNTLYSMLGSRQTRYSISHLRFEKSTRH